MLEIFHNSSKMYPDFVTFYSFFISSLPPTLQLLDTNVDFSCNSSNHNSIRRLLLDIVWFSRQGIRVRFQEQPPHRSQILASLTLLSAAWSVLTVNRVSFRYSLRCTSHYQNPEVRKCISMLHLMSLKPYSGSQVPKSAHYSV
eukprot:GHVP01000359.1.p1 GENE.GHVP01000359.1~~GHVP01000359.1.p1  ORF type:complete len:143 (+),score=1.72 GHVP01000359.1:192-620(+)